MVVLLATLTVIVCLVIDVLRRRRAEARKAVTAETPSFVVAGAQERYFHPGHGWALVEGNGQALLGIDELAGRLLGVPESVELPAAGIYLHQGDPLVTLRRAGKSLTVASPLSGEVLESNPDLAEQPALARSSPHEKGWIARILPSSLKVELRNLLVGVPAEGWREAVDAQVRSWFAPGLGVVLQDGGEWAEDLADRLSEEEWVRMARQFFHLAPIQKSMN